MYCIFNRRCTGYIVSTNKALFQPDGAFVHTHEQLWGRLWRGDFCDRAKMRRAYLESGTSHYTDRFSAILWCSVLTYFVRRVGAVTGTHWAGSMLPLLQAVNIQEWGLEISAPSPFGEPRQHDVWCVWTSRAAPRPLVFILYTGWLLVAPRKAFQ